MKRLALALVVIAATAGAAHAQTANWPDRPIHLIVPFPAGSSSDIVARIVAKGLSDRLGRLLVVENRPGASSSIGNEAVARAEPDGYTLGLANASVTIASSLAANPTYDPIKDFAPISMIGEAPYALALFPGVPAHTVQELITLAKTKPGKLTVASAGAATLANLAGVLFAKMANIELTAVQYRGTEQEVFDVIAGRVDMQFGTIPPTLQLIREGKVRAIAVTGAQRSPTLADVPTAAESGLSGYEATLWYAVVAPAATPMPIVTRLNTEVNAILHDHEAVDALAKLGVEAAPSTPRQLAVRIAGDIKKWHEVIVSAGIQPQ
jgi:tripartite-type tricarboxylate transporter receptor subunit TctC